MNSLAISVILEPKPAADVSHIIRERRFDLSQFGDLMSYIAENGITGTIMLDANQGHIVSVRVREEQRIAFD